MRREQESVCQALALAASSSVSGHYPAGGISNTTTTYVIADGVEISLQVLNYSAGIFAARQLHSCRLQGSLVTLHTPQVTFATSCTQTKLLYSQFGYICINVILN